MVKLSWQQYQKQYACNPIRRHIDTSLHLKSGHKAGSSDQTYQENRMYSKLSKRRSVTFTVTANFDIYITHRKAFSAPLCNHNTAEQKTTLSLVRYVLLDSPSPEGS